MLICPEQSNSKNHQFFLQRNCTICPGNLCSSQRCATPSTASCRERVWVGAGLDSFAALNVADHLALLANMGHTVIASIHQPRPAIFDRFNKVVVLSEGHQVFLGAPSQCVDWFQTHLGYPYVAVRDGNVPDWIMDTVSVGFTKPAAFAARWGRSPSSMTGCRAPAQRS